MGPEGRMGTQSGAQVWSNAVVIQSRGPCNRGGIPVVRKTMVDSRVLPRRAAHAAGRATCETEGRRARGRERWVQVGVCAREWVGVGERVNG